MQSVSPVFTESEVQFEYEIAKNQPEYVPVIGLPVTLQILDRNDPDVKKEIPNWAIAIRFRLSPEERAQVAAGLDLVVTQLVFGKALHPMNFQFCQAGMKPVIEITPDPPAAALRGPELASSIDEHFEQAAEKISNVLEMPAAPSAADLDAQEAANQTEQPAPAEDQPQSEM